MNSVIAQNLPSLRCTCGVERTFPVDKCGVPPLGTESFCTGCSRIWRLVRVEQSYLADVKSSWTWCDFPVPANVNGLREGTA